MEERCAGLLRNRAWEKNLKKVRSVDRWRLPHQLLPKNISGWLANSSIPSTVNFCWKQCNVGLELYAEFAVDFLAKSGR